MGALSSPITPCPRFAHPPCPVRSREHHFPLPTCTYRDDEAPDTLSSKSPLSPSLMTPLWHSIPMLSDPITFPRHSAKTATVPAGAFCSSGNPANRRSTCADSIQTGFALTITPPEPISSSSSAPLHPSAIRASVKRCHAASPARSAQSVLLDQSLPLISPRGHARSGLPGLGPQTPPDSLPDLVREDAVYPPWCMVRPPSTIDHPPPTIDHPPSRIHHPPWAMGPGFAPWPLKRFSAHDGPWARRPAHGLGGTG